MHHLVPVCGSVGRRRAGVILATIAVLGVVLGCGSGQERTTGVDELPSLSGETIGLVALDSVPSLELRHVLEEAGGIDSRALGGDVRYLEAPGDSLPDLLKQGDVAAALLPPQVAFSLRNDLRYRALTRISAAMRDITGVPVLATALLVYRDDANSRPDALAEARRMLNESRRYYEANRSDLLATLAPGQSGDSEYARWLEARQRVVLGDSSSRLQDELVSLWDVAVSAGDITEAPVLGDALFRADATATGDGGRRTVSLAVADDASHRGALYAIEQGLVSSDSVDLSVTYLSASELSQAIEAREYDIVEASPLLVATGKRSRLDLVVLSGGVEDLDSTLLFTYGSP